MKVILQQDVKDQGKKGQLIEVSDGYARNYLLPRKLAIAANQENLTVMKQQEKAKQRKMEADKAAALETAERLSEVMVKITAKSGGAGGKLFGAVTSKEISEALMEQFGIEIEKQKIVQDEHIKTFGSYEIKCKLGFEIHGTINVLVIEG
ncbi:MAG: 50S ribosomal protein L9 [Oscillospiraceae bacterium]|nr:50S ribosomal protein L9 [Oscillospiraceae bacterium]